MTCQIEQHLFLKYAVSWVASPCAVEPEPLVLSVVQLLHLRQLLF